MNALEFEQFSTAAPAARRLPGVADLKNLTPRTLIYGYDVDRNDLHVYLGADGLIHVVRYSSRAVGSDKGLIFSHSFGEAGGVKAPTDYVPNKRAYPASCDGEFCQVLRSFGASISFTDFDEAADARRLEKHGGFSGLVFSDELEAVSLEAILSADPAFPAELTARSVHSPRQALQAALELRTRLVLQASLELRVPFMRSIEKGPVFVAKTAAEAVLARARELMVEMATSSAVDQDSTSDLVKELFTPEGAFGVDIIMERPGAGDVLIEAQAPDNVVFASNPDWSVYRNDAEDAFWIEGISGLFRGRPFVAARSKNNLVQIRFSEFGLQERFIPDALAHCRMPLIPA